MRSSPSAAGAHGDSLASLPAMIARTDGEGRIVSVGKRWPSVLGHSPDETSGAWFLSYMTQDSRERMEAEIMPLFRATGECADVACQFIAKSGAVLDMRLSGVVDRGPDGEVVGMTFALRDETELNRAYARLRLSEQRYAMLLSAITDYVYTVYVKDGYPISTYHGVGCVGVTGFISEEYDEDPYLWYRMIHEDDREAVVQLAINTLSGEAPPALEHRIWHKDGSIRWIRNVIVPHYDDAGSLVSYDGLISDVTDRKRAEEALRSSEARFRAIIENGSDVITIVAPDGRIAYQSPSMERVMGYAPNELLGKNRFGFLHPASQEPSQLVFNDVLARTGSVRSYEEVFRHKDGSWRILDNVGSNLTGDAHIHGIVISSRDVTERKRQEAALVLFRNALDSSHDAIYILDCATLQVLDCNATACAMLGYAREEFLNLHSEALNPLFSIENWVRIVDALMGTDSRSCSCESAYRRKDGAEFPAEEFLHIVETDTGPVLVGVVRDITDRKRAEEERESLETRLRQAQKMEAIGQLAGGVAHDFNNLLTGILGNLNLAQNEPGLDRAQQHLEQAEKACLRAGNLVKQLLAFSRHSQVSMAPFDARGVIRDVADMIQKTIDRRIEIVMDLPDELPLIRGDADQAHTVLLNLCVNARDAVEASMRASGNQTPRITLSARDEIIDDRRGMTHQDARAGRFVRLSVSDTGSGISEEARDRIFDPFYTTKEMGKGTGLGLATVYGIAKQHGGWVDFVSVPNEGSVFSVFFPAYQGRPPAVQVTEKRDDVPGGHETILLVDDEEIVRNFAQTLLKRLGYHVIAAADGREGLDIYFAQSDQIDLVMLDLSMPHLSGREVLEQIRAVRPSARIVISSGYSAEGISDIIGDLGASAYIAKPYRIGELARALREVLDQPDDAP